MRRRWFGVFLALYVSMSALLLPAATPAYADVAGCNTNQHCVALGVTLSNAPDSSVVTTVTVTRQGSGFPDSNFTLTQRSSTIYTSGYIKGTEFDFPPCNTTVPFTPGQDPTKFNISVSSGGKVIGTLNDVKLCGGQNGPEIRQVTVNTPVAGAVNPNGGIEGTVRLKNSQGQLVPCKDGSVVRFLNNATNATSQTTVTGGNGSFASGITLPAGTYTVSTMSCSATTGESAQLQRNNVSVLDNGRIARVDIDSNTTDTYTGAAAVPPVKDPNADTAPVACHSDNGFSWLICGAIIAMVNVVDSIRDNIIAPFLDEKLVNKNDPAYAPAYQIWSIFRNVASVFFILIFFLVIIGTALGFDNYTVKKIMPHLVAGAILVPFSWTFCAFIIDIGNIVGGGITTLVQSVGIDTHIYLTSSFSAIFLGVGAGATFILAGAAATVGFGVVASLLLAFLGVFVTLVLRKIFIIICLVISPFAVIAWILPNTSKWFKAWWENFFKLVMMYPIVMMLFEAGRIFSATAAATVPANNAAGAATAAWVVPTLQIAGLILPLFAVPFAFKFAGKGLMSGSNAIGKMTGSLDKRFGKDSASAKVAAQNREFRNIQRAKNLGDRAAGATGFQKARLLGAQRLAYRRAGYATPLNKKQSGFMSNPTALLAQEAAYGKVMGQQGILDANDKNKKDGVAGETHEQRREAEGLAAQQKKIGDRAARQGLVQNAKNLGPEKLAAQNQAILEAGITAGAQAQARKGGDAVGRNKAVPLNSHQIAEHAEKLGEVDENIKNKVVTDEIEMTDILDQEAMDAANKDKPEGEHISIQRAHEMRLHNLARAAGRDAGNKMIGRDIDATVSNLASDKLTDEEIRRSIAAGEGPISEGKALSNRLRQGMQAGIGRGVEHKIADEAKDYAYNEMEHEAGGPLSAQAIVAGTRLLSRQGLADDRAKLEGAVIAGTNEDGSDKVSSSDVMSASRYSNTKAFGDSLGATQGVLKAAATEAGLDGLEVNGPAALQAAANRSFQASSIEKGRQLSAQMGSQQSVIKANAKAAERLQRQTGVSEPEAQRQILANTANAASITGYRSEAAKYAQDKMTVRDAIVNPVSDERVFAAAEFSEGRNVAAKTGTLNANFNAARAEARVNHLAAGSAAAQDASLRTAAQGAEITHTKNVSESVGKDKAAILADQTEHVSADNYIENTEEHTAEHLAEAAATVNTEVATGHALAAEKGISNHDMAKQIVKDAADKTRMAAADKATKNISESAGQAAGYREKVAAKAAEITAAGGNPATAAQEVLRERVVAGNTTGELAGEAQYEAEDNTVMQKAEATEAGIDSEADKLELAELAKQEQDPTYIPQSREVLRDTARRNIAIGTGITAGTAAGRRQAQDIGLNLGDKDVYDRDVNTKIAEGATPEDAAQAVRLERIQNAGKASRDLTSRRTQEQINTDAGVAQGVEDEILNELDQTDPDVPEATAREAAEKKVFDQNMEGIGKVSKSKATNDRMVSTARDRGVSKSLDAAVDIVETEEHEKALEERKTKSEEAGKKVIDKAKNKKREEIRDKAYKDALNSYATKKSNGYLSDKQMNMTPQQYAHSVAQNAVKNAKDEIIQAGEDKNVKKLSLKAAGAAARKVKVPPVLNRAQAEREVFTAAARATEETTMRQEAVNHAVRSALSDASKSPLAKSANDRIKVAKTPAMEREAEEIANQEAQRTLTARPYEKIVADATKVKVRDIIQKRAKEEGKNTLDAMGDEYKDAVVEGLGYNPFGNLAIDEVEMSNGPLEGLQIIFKKAIQNKDWPKAMAAMERISTSNGGYEKAKELQMLDVKDGGLGGRKWRTVDDTDPNASELKFIWDQGSSSGAKSNTDQNKPIHVAARDFDVPKLASTNDKQMVRYLEWYENGDTELKDAKKAVEAKIQALPPDKRTGAEYESLMNELNEYDSYNGLRREGIKDMNETIPDVLAASEKGGSQKGFGTATLKVLYNRAAKELNLPPEQRIFTDDVRNRILEFQRQKSGAAAAAEAEGTGPIPGQPPLF